MDCEREERKGGWTVKEKNEKEERMDCKRKEQKGEWTVKEKNEKADGL